MGATTTNKSADDHDDDKEGLERNASSRSLFMARLRTQVLAAMLHSKLQYECIFILSGILTVALDQPLFSAFALFELCFWSGSRTVIDAIRFNLGKMMQTMLLGRSDPPILSSARRCRRCR